VDVSTAIAMRPPQVVTKEGRTRTAETEKVAPAPKKEKAALQRSPVPAKDNVPPPEHLRNIVFVASEVGSVMVR
jgi:hypothetical protein